VEVTQGHAVVVVLTVLAVLTVLVVLAVLVVLVAAEAADWPTVPVAASATSAAATPISATRLRPGCFRCRPGCSRPRRSRPRRSRPRRSLEIDKMCRSCSVSITFTSDTFRPWPYLTYRQHVIQQVLTQNELVRNTTLGSKQDWPGHRRQALRRRARCPAASVRRSLAARDGYRAHRGAPPTPVRGAMKPDFQHAGTA
jgi:hypothetical protein